MLERFDGKLKPGGSPAFGLFRYRASKSRCDKAALTVIPIYLIVPQRFVGPDLFKSSDPIQD